MDREALLTSLQLAAPALAKKDYIQVFTHFNFDGETVTAYNDLFAIRVPCDAPIKGALKGSTLLGLLSKSSAKELEIEQQEDDVKVHGGVTNLTLPVLSSDKFLFEFPNHDDADYSFEVTPELTTGIDDCLISTVADPQMPSLMGVHLDFEQDDTVTVYATDNDTITRYTVKDIDGLPDDARGQRVIIPTHFAKLLSKYVTGGDGSKLHVTKDYVTIITSNNVEMFCKLVNADHALDFALLIDQSLDKQAVWSKMPRSFANAVDRSTVLYDSGQNPVCKAEVKGDKLYLITESNYGQVSDNMTIRGKHPAIKVSTNPLMLERVVEKVDKLSIQNVCIALSSGENYLHLIANLPD